MKHRHTAMRGMAVSATAMAVATITTSGLTATAAHAGTGDVAYDCLIFSTHFDYNATVTMTAPASAKVGDTVNVTADLSDLPGVSPVPVDKWSTTGKAITSGAQAGLFDFAGAERTGPIAAKQPIPIGSLTGTLPLTSAGEVDVTMGDITVTATAFGSQVPINCTPKSPPAPLATIQVTGGGGGPGEPGGQRVAVAPGSVKQGGSVTVSGTGWQPGTVDLALCDANGAACAPGDLTDVTAAVSAAGQLAGSAKIATSAGPGARTLLVTQGAVSRSAPLTVTADDQPPTGGCADGSGAAATAACDEQKINVVVNGGPLTMSRQPGVVTLSPVTLNGTEQTSTGALKQVKVVDARGGTVGWSLTGTLTDFSAAGGTKIPAAALTWKPSCAAVGTASPVTAGTEGALGTSTAATLCSGAGGAGGIVGGTYNAGAGLLLKVPPVTGAGEYTAVLTLTLS